MAVNEAEFAVIKDHVEDMKKDVSELKRVVVKGTNGSKSIMIRLETAERHANRVPDMLTDMNKLKGAGIAITIILAIIQIYQFMGD